MSSPNPNLFTSLNFADAGLLIISKFPIIESHFEHFEIAGSFDFFAQKGFLFAKIRVSDSFVHLITTHLNAPFAIAGGQNSHKAIKIIQIEQIK